MFRHGNLHRPVLCIVEFLILLFFSGLVSPFQISAAPPAQDFDVCALLPPGAASTSKIPTVASAPEYKGGCQATYRTGIFTGTNRAEIMLMANVQIWSPSDIARQRVMQCSMVAPGSGTCISGGVGEIGADFTDKAPSTYWWADSARGCFWFKTSSDYSADPGVIAQGRALHKQIDDKLKTLSPCPGIPTPVPAQLNVGIGGNYDEANERVNVTADVTQHPNVGIGDDFYEWTLDGAPIQKGKELKSIEYDTTNLAEGEHEIVVKVTDIPNNVTGGATFKFTVKRNKGNSPPGNTSNGQLQVTTPSGTQPVTPATRLQIPRGGQATLEAKCDELRQVVVALKILHTVEWDEQWKVLGPQGKDPRTKYGDMLFIAAIVYRLNCGKLNLGALPEPRPAARGSGRIYAFPSLQQATDSPAQLEMELQSGPGQFQPQLTQLALIVKTGAAKIFSQGKNDFAVFHDPDTDETYVSCHSGSVTVQPTNASLAPITLQAGQNVVVTSDKIGNLPPTQTAPPGSSVPGTTLSMPPLGAAEPYPSVTGRTIQFAQRRVPSGETVLIPVWLMHANDVANINAEVMFDANVARPEGNLTKGYLLDNALFSANPNESGIVRMGFAQATNLANGTGTLAYIPFRAVGKPGERTMLTANVTALHNQNGGALSMDRINGEIVITNKDGTLPGGSGTDSLPPGACSGKTQLTELDALCALEISVQLRPAMQIVDVDGSGTIDSRDAVLILMRVVNQ